LGTPDSASNLVRVVGRDDDRRGLELFFPLSAHNDLRFQLIGESVEALVTFSALVIVYAACERSRRKLGSRTSEVTVALLQGVFFALATFALEWRDVFPGSRFDAHAIQHSLWSHLFGGCAFACSCTDRSTFLERRLELKKIWSVNRYLF
jgi:hypothetical protein